ncbi:MAG: sirohydrochlorin nickelochelatase [Methanobrevibacter sp.]|uniref:sirohydrochlorin nickelochelatase n=1 Tax=Methanobrevibacter sp. TaxID=66852 RepID=UPI0026E0F096|nr:sirohydrochlorin nickelochelatase [Methanobrevibacter sp.]MDO5848679.1 sirohydrochlorin nickelochelatase [Methanobrevibacter sp.]
MKDFDFKNSKTAILLLSHGSRLPEGKKVIEAYTNMFKEEYPDAIVDYAFMEIRQPDIPTTINKLTQENDLEKIIVVPVFIAHGLHTKRDIPKILGIEVEELDIEDSHHHHHDHGHDHHHHHHHHDHDHDEKAIDFDGEIILTDPLGIEESILEIIKNRVKDNL